MEVHHHKAMLMGAPPTLTAIPAFSVPRHPLPILVRVTLALAKLIPTHTAAQVTAKMTCLARHLLVVLGGLRLVAYNKKLAMAAAQKLHKCRIGSAVSKAI